MRFHWKSFSVYKVPKGMFFIFVLRHLPLHKVKGQQGFYCSCRLNLVRTSFFTHSTVFFHVLMDGWPMKRVSAAICCAGTDVNNVKLEDQW